MLLLIILYFYQIKVYAILILFHGRLLILIVIFEFFLYVKFEIFTVK